MKREDVQKCLIEIAEHLPDEISTDDTQVFQTMGEDLNGRPQPVVLVLNVSINQVVNSGDYCTMQSILGNDISYCSILGDDSSNNINNR